MTGVKVCRDQECNRYYLFNSIINSLLLGQSVTGRSHESYTHTHRREWNITVAQDVTKSSRTVYISFICPKLIQSSLFIQWSFSVHINTRSRYRSTNICFYFEAALGRMCNSIWICFCSKLKYPITYLLFTEVWACGFPYDYAHQRTWNKNKTKTKLQWI